MNARRLRGAHTAEAVAKAAKRAGLKWNSGRVAYLEAGRISPTLPTLLALAMAFGDVLSRAVALTELLQAEGFVQLNDDFPPVDADVVIQALRGEPVAPTVGQVQGGVDEAAAVLTGAEAEWADLPERPDGPAVGKLRAVHADSGPTEDRIAASLGITTLRLSYETARLWGRTFTQERDHRAGDEANAQKRGRIARTMKGELQQEIS
ncbi:hypothetical protein GZH49_01690 [Nocardia terpenica]|uniref:hypothetical protein n=1 Tax=Nocardia terpenica TaxID=455432 RepID=UPI002FE00911